MAGWVKNIAFVKNESFIYWWCWVSLFLFIGGAACHCLVTALMYIFWKYVDVLSLKCIVYQDVLIDNVFFVRYIFILSTSQYIQSYSTFKKAKVCVMLSLSSLGTTWVHLLSVTEQLAKFFSIGWDLCSSTYSTVRCHYNVVYFLQNPHERHPIACP